MDLKPYSSRQGFSRFGRSTPIQRTPAEHRALNVSKLDIDQISHSQPTNRIPGRSRTFAHVAGGASFRRERRDAQGPGTALSLYLVAVEAAMSLACFIECAGQEPGT